MCGELYDVRRICRQICGIAPDEVYNLDISTPYPQRVPSMRVLASGFPCPFSDIILYPAMSNQDCCHFGDSLLPLPGILYSPSSVQGAGWFDYPAYFVDEGSDGTRQVFCWSVSTYTGGTIHYVWRVYQNFRSELAFGLYEQFRHHGPTPFGTGDYLFITLTLDRRAAWKIVKPPNNLISPHVPMALYSIPQLHWFGSYSASTVNLMTQLHAPPPPYSVYKPVDSVPQNAPGLYVNLAGMSSNAASSPPVQFSDASSDASVDAFSPDASENEDATWDSGRYFSTDEAGVATLIVPGHLKSQQAVKDFITSALSSGELGAGVREVKCSRCKNNKTKKSWDIKPSNLERHILAHLNIKCHICTICLDGFTTKDQMKKHMAKKHSETRTDTLDDEDQNTTVEHISQDIYATTYPVTIGPPVQEIEPWMTGQVCKTLPTRDVIPLGINCSFGY
ncbi:unnamed protein product [Rhizoctonia solani]|uniref:C2H2-type domain-containing protein n=1 Tax=Rhizoctonia solani TaxID=456999 RepID=A0A8H3D017_9AGAM|nr:unnamed protein product [Rhizoctonia solani]